MNFDPSCRNQTQHGSSAPERLPVSVSDSAEEGICCTDYRGHVTYLNAAATNLLGYTHAELSGRSFNEIFHPSPLLPSPHTHEVQAGQASFLRKDGSRLSATYKRYALVAGDTVIGSVIALSATVTRHVPEQDSTVLLGREKQALDEAQKANARLELLVKAAEVFASTLDFKTTLGNVVQLALPYLGVRATVNLLDKEGQALCRVAVAELPPEGDAVVTRPYDRFPLTLVAETPTGKVLDTMQAIRLNGMHPDMIDTIVADSGHRERFKKIGLSGLMVVPIVAGHELLGVFTFGRNGDYTEQDEKLAIDLARLASLAVRNALLYREANSYRRVLDQAPDAIWFLDREGKFTYLNETAQEHYSTDRQRPMVGRSVLEMVGTKSRSRTKAQLGDLLEGNSIPPFVSSRVGPNGIERSHSYSAVPIVVDEQILGSAVFVRDVTDLTKTQERLKNTVAHLQLIDDVGQAILEGRTRQELMDRLVDTLAGRYGYEAAFCFHLSTSESVLELRSKAGAHADEVSFDLRIPLPNWWEAEGGRAASYAQRHMGQRVLALHALPECYQAELTVPIVYQERCVAVICVVTRAKSGFSSEHQVTLDVVAGHVTRIWERMHLHEELQSKSKEMEAYLYATTHDLRSPLVNVLGFSQELEYGLQDIQAAIGDSNLSEQERDHFKRILNEDIRPAIKYIVVSVRKMESLVDGILQLSRMGRQPLTMEWIEDVHEMVSDVLASKRHQLNLSGAHVEVGQLPPVTADRTRLAQILDNLIGNAVKYLDPEREGRIRIFGETLGTKVRLCVEDNGVGIHADHLEQLFRPFHRLNVKGSGPEGHGLGLSIVERAVKRHSGRIWVESQPGQGSRFWIELPQRNV